MGQVQGIKQDPRAERPQARIPDPNLPADFDKGGREQSKDWVAVGDVPSRPAFSVAKFFMRVTQLVARPRAAEEPMFLAADGLRPYLYRAFAGELRDSCIKHGGTDQDLPHGLRVRGYNDSKSTNGKDITKSHSPMHGAILNY